MTELFPTEQLASVFVCSPAVLGKFDPVSCSEPGLRGELPASAEVSLVDNCSLRFERRDRMKGQLSSAGL